VVVVYKVGRLGAGPPFLVVGSACVGTLVGSQKKLPINVRGSSGSSFASIHVRHTVLVEACPGHAQHVTAACVATQLLSSLEIANAMSASYQSSPHRAG
jgi:hypothetical protein